MNVEESSSSSTLVNYYSVHDDDLIPLLMKEDWTVDYKATQNKYPDTVQWYLNEKSQVVDFGWEKVIFTEWLAPLFEKMDSIYRKALKNPGSIKDIPSSLSYDLEASLKGEWTALNSFVKYAEVKNVKNQLVWYFLLTPQEFPDFVYAPVAGEAKIGNQGFLTLQDAIDSANDEDTIVLTKDVELKNTLRISKSLNIDLNGKKVINKIEYDKNLKNGWAFALDKPVNFKVDGTKEGSAMYIPDTVNDPSGFIELTAQAVGSELILNWGEYAWPTNDWSFFRIRGKDKEGKTKVELNNLVAWTNYRVLTSDEGHSIALKVNGGTYILKNDNDKPGFLLYGSKDALAVFIDVTINSEYRQPVSISNQKAEFYNSTISVEKANAKKWLSSAISVDNDGQVTVDGWTYTSKLFWLYVFSSGGKIIVKKGTIKWEEKAIQIDSSGFEEVSKSEVVIEDWSLTGDVKLSYNSGEWYAKLSIFGGDLNGKLEKNGKNSEIAISGGTFPEDVVQYTVGAKCSIRNADSKYEVKDCPQAINFYTSNENPIPVVLDGTTIKLEETRAVLRKLVLTNSAFSSNELIGAVLVLPSLENVVEIEEVAGEKLLFLNNAKDKKTQVYREKFDGIFGDKAFKNNTETEGKVANISFDLKNAVAPSWVDKNESIKSYNVVMTGGKEIWYTLHTKDKFGRFYAPKNYTITFDTNGGTAVDPIIGGALTTINAPKNPTKNCHSFKGWSPALQTTMPAENITLKAQWSYTCGGGSSRGGGGSSLRRDNCPNGDHSPSYYDGSCGDALAPKVNVTTGSTSTAVATGSTTTDKGPTQDQKADIPKDELTQAYERAYQQGITTQNTIEKAQLDRAMTRAEMAKMMVVFAVKVLGKKLVLTGAANYSDVDTKLGDLEGYIQLAYQLQIMGIDAKGNAITHFNPQGEVSRAEFATVLSRILFGDKYNQAGADFASKHLEALKTAKILKDTNPMMKELRGWVMLMLMRAEGVK